MSERKTARPVGAVDSVFVDLEVSKRVGRIVDRYGVPKSMRLLGVGDVVFEAFRCRGHVRTRTYERVLASVVKVEAEMGVPA